jgi:hypothetical protein
MEMVGCKQEGMERGNTKVQHHQPLVSTTLQPAATAGAATTKSIVYEHQYCWATKEWALARSLNQLLQQAPQS